VAIYQGTDPTNASSWSLVGVYDFGPPLGPRALVKFGGDLALVTADGVIPLSQGLKLDRSQQQEVALTSKIMNAFSQAVKAYGANFGWQGILYPGMTPSPSNPAAIGGSLALFKVPAASDGTAYQFIQNVLTGAWCRFTDINATCWETANNAIYFGGANAAGTKGVFQWDVGSDDDGAPIVATVQQAFSAFGQPGRQKRFTMIRALLNTNGLVLPALDILADYKSGRADRGGDGGGRPGDRPGDPLRLDQRRRGGLRGRPDHADQPRRRPGAVRRRPGRRPRLDRLRRRLRHLGDAPLRSPLPADRVRPGVRAGRRGVRMAQEQRGNLRLAGPPRQL